MVLKIGFTESDVELFPKLKVSVATSQSSRVAGAKFWQYRANGRGLRSP